MKTIQGDLISLAIEGRFDVIVHGCNCFCKMGAGIAKQIKKEFPGAYVIDCISTKIGDISKLGNFTEVKVTIIKDITFMVINAYIQYNYGSKGHADYDAIRKVFSKIREKYTGKRIAYPKIGAGLAKGDWDIIYKIICEELQDEDHYYIEYKI
jgi:O-acetyl-ADP-ribose deacetylase (regulator of RNase III)